MPFVIMVRAGGGRLGAAPPIGTAGTLFAVGNNEEAARYSG